MLPGHVPVLVGGEWSGASLVGHSTHIAEEQQLPCSGRSSREALYTAMNPMHLLFIVDEIRARAYSSFSHASSFVRALIGRCAYFSGLCHHIGRCSSGLRLEVSMSTESVRRLAVTRIYSDEAGESHFGSFTINMTGSGPYWPQ